MFNKDLLSKYIKWAPPSRGRQNEDCITVNCLEDRSAARDHQTPRCFLIHLLGEAWAQRLDGFSRFLGGGNQRSNYKAFLDHDGKQP